MTTANTFGLYIKEKLEAVTGVENVYQYIPDINDMETMLSALCDSNNRINAWFVTRTGFSVIRRGEGRTVPTGTRIRKNVFTINGFIALADDAQVDSSEEAFQDLCDDIEAALSPVGSAGVTDHGVWLHSISAEVNYQPIGNVLCHHVLFRLEIDDYLATTYTA